MIRLSLLTGSQWSSADTLILEGIPAPNVVNLQTTAQQINNGMRYILVMPLDVG